MRFQASGQSYLMNNLESIWEYCQTKLEVRKGSWRTAVLATLGESGPDARTIIIREYQWPWLTFYSDARTSKVADLKRDPTACAVIYDPKKRVQVRLKGQATVLTSGPEVDQAIASLGSRAQADYNSILAPGSKIESDSLARKSADALNFALIKMELSELDCLLLRTEGHSRAVFSAPDTGSWLVP